MKTATCLRCISCGFETDLFQERKFRCPKCNDLFDVIHEIPQLPVQAWTKKFDFFSCCHRPSGVWRFKDWIMPTLPPENVVTLGEGMVPIVRAGSNLRNWLGQDLDLWLILEGKTPSASFKDFGMTVLVSVAKAAGVKAIACASTGDTSASLAAYCGAAGIQCAVILPYGKVTQEQILQLKIFGAKVITLPGSFDDCMKVLEQLVSDYGVYPGNSLNPTRIEGHQATVFLTAQFFEWELPNWFVVPIGNGSNCSSIGKGLRLMKNQGFEVKTRILGCQSEAANPMATSWRRAGGLKVNQLEWEASFEPIKVGETIATAARIGDPVSRRKVMREIIASRGGVVDVSEQELTQAVLVCGKDGHFVCPQTGIALAGLRRGIKEGWFKKKSRVIVVSTADGLKFTGPFCNGLKDYILKAPNCWTETVAKMLDL